jgi:arginine deiminase
MKPRKLLLVEDDAGWIEYLRKAFEPATIIVDGGTGWADAIQKNPDIDLILLDYQLPGSGTDGGAILAELRRIGTGACIVLLSGIRKGGFTAGDLKDADDWVDKDASPDRGVTLRNIGRVWDESMREACAPAIQNEWGPLRTVIVHTPAAELRYVFPDDPEYLMEDAPDEEMAAAEHREFVTALRKVSHARVLDVKDLVFDVLEALSSAEREEALAQVLFEEPERKAWAEFRRAGGCYPHLVSQAIEDLRGAGPGEMVEALYCGRNSSDWERHKLTFGKGRHVSLLLEMNNAYFTRDPGFALDGVFGVASMTRRVRRREPRLLQLVLDRHPWFAGWKKLSPQTRRDSIHRIEGGDVVAIGPHELAVGWSERTSFETIEALALELFREYGYTAVHAIPIPRRRAFMHLDTVFSIVGDGTAVYYPEATEALGGFHTLRAEGEPPEVTVRHAYNAGSFIDFLQLERGFESPVPTAGGHPGLARANQFNDGTNCFAIADRIVVSYAANRATNDALAKAHVTVIKIPGSELVKGRGGPRCMTMPIARAPAGPASA